MSDKVPNEPKLEQRVDVEKLAMAKSEQMGPMLAAMIAYQVPEFAKKD